MTNDPTANPHFTSRGGCYWLFAAAVALFLTLLLLLPSIQRPRSGRRSNCVNNLKQIGIALHNYYDANRAFPPAYFADANGKPIHSWRAILLPYFEEVGLKGMPYRFDQPWDSPHNLKLADKMPAVYRCPNSTAPPNEPSYLAIVGTDAGWPNAKSRKLREVRDGTANTIALVEVANSGVNWLDPRDLSLEEAMQKVESPHTGGANHLFFDGSVHFLLNKIDRETYRGLLTANGRESVEIPE